MLPTSHFLHQRSLKLCGVGGVKITAGHSCQLQPGIARDHPMPMVPPLNSQNGNWEIHTSSFHITDLSKSGCGGGQLGRTDCWLFLLLFLHSYPPGWTTQINLNTSPCFRFCFCGTLKTRDYHINPGKSHGAWNKAWQWEGRWGNGLIHKILRMWDQQPGYEEWGGDKPRPWRISVSDSGGRVDGDAIHRKL